MPSGGYRKPENPAPVAGPGNLSRRTDGGPADKQPMAKLPNAGYGEQKAFQEIQQGAPVKQAPRPTRAPQGALPLGLDAPSARPGEPVTFGADAGAGPGQEALGLLDTERLTQNDIAALVPYIPAIQNMVDRHGNANTSTLALVRYLRSLT